jgi:ribosomal protein L37E
MAKKKRVKCDRCGDSTYHNPCRDCAEKIEIEESGFGATRSSRGEPCIDYVNNAIRAPTYSGGGVVEDTQYEAKQLREILARLLDKLHRENIFDQREIEYIVGGF